MTLALNSYQTMAVGILLYYLGKFLKARIKFLRTYSIPNPVIGGILFALLNLALHQSGVGAIKLDTVQQSFFMNMFFTSIGFTASFALLKKGGRDVLILTIVCAILVTLQDVIGVGLAKVVGLHPLLGLCAGSVPLVGGHGTSAAFGPFFENMGVERASAVAIAMATFGLISGSLMGGPIAHRLISKYNLHSNETNVSAADQASDVESAAVVPMVPEKFMLATGEILLCMGVGTYVAAFFKGIGLVFPFYISSMLVAAVLRNTADHSSSLDVPIPEIQTMGDVGLNIFLSMALMSLRIWELFDIAGALSVIAVAQVILMALFTYFVVFNAMGRDYDAAVEVSAVCGFGMGATPNAMANMSAVTAVHGPSTRAFFCVPLVGALFIDFINSSVIMVFTNLFK